MGQLLEKERECVICWHIVLPNENLTKFHIGKYFWIALLYLFVLSFACMLSRFSCVRLSVTPMDHGLPGSFSSLLKWASQVVLMVKNLLANTRDVRDMNFIPVLGISPGRGHGDSLQYSCLENSHGQRNLAGYSP